MKFSILISATGNAVDPNYWPCDTTLSDVMNACAEAATKSPDDFRADEEPSEPGDTEYAYLATENGTDGLRGAFLEGMANGSPKDRERLADWAMERWENDSDVWWATCADYQASGILPRAEAEELLDRIGAYADDVETMGTLGGPANPCGMAPDIDYRVETQAAILCVRVTPIIDVKPREGRWERVRAAVLACHGC